MPNEVLNADLLRAVLRGDRTAVVSLLDRGADIDTSTTRLLSAQGGQDRLPWDRLRYAAEHGATPLMIAAGAANAELVELLLARGASVNAVHWYWCTAIYYAAAMGHRETTRLLLQAGADVSPGMTDEAALRRWVRVGYPDLVCALLDRGVDINARDDRGRTALMWAAAHSRALSPNYNYGHVITVQLLLERGADVDAQNKYGLTALMFAGGDMRLVRLLLSHGPDLTLTNHSGRTALANATIRGFVEVQELLRQAGAKE